MKRTRRIEVIRYSRRVTWSEGGVGPVPDGAAEAQADALLLEAAASEVAAAEVAGDCGRPRAGAEPHAHARGLLLRLLKRLWRD